MSEKTLKEKAYTMLRALIMQGELRSGEFLSERSLVERMEMSRTPIRAALERLEAEGHVTYTPNRGIFVSEVTIDKAIDVYDFRMIIESSIVRKLASRKLTDELRQWFKESLARQWACVEADDTMQFAQEDSEFHRQLVYAYDNKEIIVTMDRLQDKLYRIALNVLRKDANRIKISYEDHASLVELIEQGQGEEAAAALIQHLEFGKRILLE
ncbi:GntR family transcriptional regulator [Paenibacillus daejeonensis]|uniref:GntR family transcriptional regulator n=1 Tax=Paenibacillus daejeonensis TaxID=135193 RepID=UPI000366AF39|nr:GntR family transcriptional regulator [Paenibacillus daejeonensis]